MHELPLRHFAETDADALLDGLTTQQFINPHQSVETALDAAREKLGFCPLAAENAIRWLQLDAQQTIGRLRRTEMMQLARCIDRYWREATAAAGR